MFVFVFSQPGVVTNVAVLPVLQLHHPQVLHNNSSVCEQLHFNPERLNTSKEVSTYMFSKDEISI